MLDEESPLPFEPFDLIVNLSSLATVNDLPGALIHIRNALKPGGLMIASMVGAGSLPMLRQAMYAADGERPAARMHPMVEIVPVRSFCSVAALRARSLIRIHFMSATGVSTG